jgi:hypothetical protein
MAAGDAMKLATTGMVRTLLALAAVVFVAACGPGIDPDAAKSATVRVSLTDAPACGFEHVHVTVEKVRIHASSAADERSADWTDIIVNPAKRIDLLELSNGRMEELGQARIAEGDYTQIRLVLRQNGNSVVPTGGLESSLATPSDLQTGIKVIRQFSVASNETVDVVLDFDACRSIVQRGSTSYSLKPVVSGHLIDGAIEGIVDPTVTDARVSVQKNGAVIRSTAPAAGTGAFSVPFLDSAESPYEVVITATDRATAVISGVPATTSAVTSLGTVEMPASGLLTPSRTASGIVSPIAAREAAEVRAMQAVGVPAVEIAARNVNSLTGAYSLSLPRDAARLAVYSTALPLTFVAQTATEGQYTLQAQATDFTPKTEPADIRTTALTIDFTLDAAP